MVNANKNTIGDSVGENNPIYSTQKTADLSANPQNARTHTKAQIDKIAKSIEAFGFINPIVTDSDGVIFAGHGRLSAAEKLNIEEVPCVLVDHLDEAQKRAYMLADNRIATESGWDESILKDELESLGALDFDLSITGFDSDEVDAIFGVVGEVDLPELSDKSPDFQSKTFTIHNTQAETVENAIRTARSLTTDNGGLNENSNGNALTLICEQWLKIKK